MVDLVIHSLFTLGTAAVAFWTGVKLTERHHAEKEFAIERTSNLTRIYYESHDVQPVEQPQQNPIMAAPVPMPPSEQERFKKAFAPGGPIQTRLSETGQATYLFPGQHMN